MHVGAWVLTGVFALLWLLCALGNGSAVRERFRPRKEGQNPPSFMPFIGAIFAVIAVIACPWKNPWLLAALVAAVILDFGSLPYLLLQLLGPALTADGRRMFFRRVAVARGTHKWGGGFLLWLLVSGGIGNLAESRGWNTDAIFGVVTLVFWTVWAGVILYSQKYSQKWSA